MRDSLTLGRIAGISFGVNWSWVIVFALIVWTLATGIFPTQNPDHGQSTYIAMAIVAAIFFFASLLAHGERIAPNWEGITLVIAPDRVNGRDGNYGVVLPAKPQAARAMPCRSSRPSSRWRTSC